MLKEDKLVGRIAKAARSISGRRDRGALRLGIGDDAAILSPQGGKDWAISCDAFLEQIHFLADVHPADSVGYKSLVRAASDLVAMGAAPRYFLLTLALPESRTGSWLDAFLAGMRRAARYLRMQMIGGDTTKNPRVSIGVTVMGEISRGHAVTRTGARAGDLIYVTGRLGGAQLGLELLRRKIARARNLRGAWQAHLYPRIHVKLGEWLARNQVASAMMDISDGLSTDLSRLCSASRVGARIRAKEVPSVKIPKALRRPAHRLKSDELEMALHGGDDYGLLFTVDPRRRALLRRAPDAASLACIGEITSKRQILLVDDDGTRPLRNQGWDPFSTK